MKTVKHPAPDQVDAILAVSCHVKTCSRCGGPRDNPGQRYCLACFAAYMRDWRKTHPMSAEQRAKDNIRSAAGHAKRRGKLIPQPCQVCGSEDKIEMHHPDYNQPLLVEWFCRPCHVQLHLEAA